MTTYHPMFMNPTVLLNFQPFNDKYPNKLTIITTNDTVVTMTLLLKKNLIE